MKLKLMSATFAMLSLAAHATESQKFDEIAGETPQETVEMKTCAREMQAYSHDTSLGNPEIYFQHEFPSYRCFEHINLTIRNGRFKNNYKNPSKEEYKAWTMVVDHYLYQPFVKEVVDELKSMRRRDASARFPKSHFNLNLYIAEKNYELLRQGRNELVLRNPFSQAVSVQGNASEATQALREACSVDLRDAAYGLKNKSMREQAVSAYNAQCKGAEKRIAELAAKAQAEAKSRTEFTLPTKADMLPHIQGQSVSNIKAFFETEGLLTRTVGADDAKVTLQVILDLDDDRAELNRARRFLASIWPAVRDGQLKLVIAPTNAASGEVASNAAFLATRTPYAFLDAWMERGLDKNASAVSVQRDGSSLQPTDAMQRAISRTPEQLIRTGVLFIPSFRMLNDGGAEYPVSIDYFSTGSKRLRDFGVTTPPIYSKEQVAAWSKKFTAHDFDDVSFTIPPFDFKDELRAPLEPDWDNARQVCGGGECWKAPAPKKKGWF